VEATTSEAVRPPEAAAPPALSPRRRLLAAPDAEFWLDRVFWLAEHAPGVLRVARAGLARLAFRFSPAVRQGTLANAARILGPGSTDVERTRLARAVVENFLLFCHDVGRSARRTPDELLGRIDRVEGQQHYDAARALRRGAIVLTAHMGSFEVGMAALRRPDPRVHVVFRRDASERFERMRSAVRARLGVIEAPVDDGWTVWMRLREALLNDEVVVLQGDRVMPGQKGQRVPVLGADMLLPAGPVKLALATGAPVVPVFSVRTPAGKVRVCIEPAVVVDQDESGAGVARAMEQVADVIGKYVAAHPEQWLMLQPAWCEDSSS
jgi:lauroyl/myristoyl acyltransferase